MKHEENVDLRKVSKIAKIDSHMKVIQINNGATIGIKMWGKIDYLCNILGYRIVKSGISVGDKFDSNVETKQHNREVKKQLKEEVVNNNMKKNKKKKLQ